MVICGWWECGKWKNNTHEYVHWLRLLDGVFLSQTCSLPTTTDHWRSAYREAWPVTLMTPSLGSWWPVDLLLMTHQLCGTGFQRPQHTPVLRPPVLSHTEDPSRARSPVVVFTLFTSSLSLCLALFLSLDFAVFKTLQSVYCRITAIVCFKFDSCFIQLPSVEAAR